MKKLFIKIVACMLLCITAFSLIACGSKPELDISTAEKNLQDKDYLVYVIDDFDEIYDEISYFLPGSLAVAIDEVLVAEGDNDMLAIISFNDNKTAKLVYQELKAQKKLSEDLLKNEVNTLENILKKYEDDLSSNAIDDMKDSIKETNKEIEELNEEYTYGRRGKTLWIGTEDAIKDSKD